MTYGRSVRKALDTFNFDHNKWPELAADRLTWWAMLRRAESRRPTTARRLRPPAALPIALTRPRRPMAATNAAIQNSMQQLAATTRVGVCEEKDLHKLNSNSSFRTKVQTPTQTVSLILTPRLYTKDRTSL